MINMKLNNVLVDLQTYPNFNFHTIFGDATYNLSTVWEIRPDGLPDVKGKAKDFMNKWKGFTGPEIDQFFKESYRVLKYGGFVLLFGVDRQLFPYQYYAVKNGFEIGQSLYWYYLSNFPKATNASKLLMKRLGDLGEYAGMKKIDVGMQSGNMHNGRETEIRETEIRRPTNPLAKLFEGYKYGNACLKQVNETIMVFRKPCKNENILNDLVKWPDDDEISPSILNIDGSRIPFNNDDDKESSEWGCYTNFSGGNFAPKGNADYKTLDKENAPEQEINEAGRFPTQMFVSPEAAEVIDQQSGIVSFGNKPGGYTYNESQYEVEGFIRNCKPNAPSNYGDTGGASRILHVCAYESEEYDIINYCSKVSNAERNAGLEGFEKNNVCATVSKGLNDQVKKCPIHNVANKSGDNFYACGCKFIYEDEDRFTSRENNHPTVKPISLIYRIAQLFKLPDECKQKVYIPFAGTGSEIIGFMKAGYKNITACEIDEQWIPIAKARIEYWEGHELTNYKKSIQKEVPSETQLGLFDIAVNQ